MHCDYCPSDSSFLALPFLSFLALLLLFSRFLFRSPETQKGCIHIFSQLSGPACVRHWWDWCRWRTVFQSFFMSRWWCPWRHLLVKVSLNSKHVFEGVSCWVDSFKCTQYVTMLHYISLLVYHESYQLNAPLVKCCQTTLARNSGSISSLEESAEAFAGSWETSNCSTSARTPSSWLQVIGDKQGESQSRSSSAICWESDSASQGCSSISSSTVGSFPEAFGQEPGVPHGDPNGTVVSEQWDPDGLVLPHP